METLVATVMIVIVFMIASMILNNLFSNTIKSNTRAIDAHLNEVQYLYLNDKIKTPYFDEFKDWQISVTLFKSEGANLVQIEGKNPNTNQTVTKELLETE